jgi:integrase/recombinase XerD
MGNYQKYWQSSNENVPTQTRTILNEYLLYLKITYHAEGTITKYRWILERFFSDCPIPLKDLTSEDVLSWLNDFSLGKSARTIYLFLSCLSFFFEFCLEEDYIENMVIKKRWRPKLPQSLPRYLSEQEYDRVKLAAESFSLRDQALILFLFSSGCRCEEASNLNIQDIDLEQRTAKVNGKGRKILRTRTVYFSEECALILNEYLRKRSFNEADAVFMNRKGQRLLPKGIYEVVKKIGKKAGIKLHPRCCRHTFATNMLAIGASIGFINEVMGHANLNTTLIYARIYRRLDVSLSK